MHRREFITISSAAAALALAGCNPTAKSDVESAPVDESKLRELKVLLVDDEAFLEPLVRDWKATSQRPLTAANVTADELLKMPEIPADLLIYPPALLGALAESGRIAPLDDRTLDKPELDREEIIDLARVELGVWGKKTFGVPLSAPHFLIVYRSDWITTPPATWGEFDELCKKLPADQVSAVDPLAKESRSLLLFTRAVSRARGKNQHSTLFDVASMKALLPTPPFTRALQELVARATGREEETLAATPQTIWEQLTSGKVSVGLTWPRNKPHPGTANSSKDSAALRFSLPPGGKELYSHAENNWSESDVLRRYPVLGGGGRLVSAVRSKMGVRDAANLLVLLAGKSRSDSLGPFSKDAFPLRQSQLPKSGRWLGGIESAEAAKQFAETVVDSLTSDDFLLALNLPGQAEYVAALEDAIELAIRGTKTPEEALQAAAGKWDELTQKLGQEKQKLAYLRSLGLEPAA